MIFCIGLIYLTSFLLRENYRQGPVEIHFWRTTDKAEVDFVIEGRELVPVEVKYKEAMDRDISRSLRSFISKYLPKTVYLVHIGEKQSVLANSTEVQLVPYTDLLDTQFDLSDRFFEPLPKKILQSFTDPI